MQLRATRAGSIGNRRPAALTLSQLLPSGAGRVAAIYSDPAKPSYDECIAKNVAAIAAGRPQDCVLFADAAGQTPVVYPIGAGQGKGLLLDRSAGLVRGAELFNGDHLTGWSFGAGIAGAADKITFTSAATTESCIRAILTNGKLYEVRFRVQSYVSGQVRLIASSGQTGPAISANGTYTQKIWTTGAAGNIGFQPITASFTGEVVLESAKELPGHHQQQPTAAARGEFSRRYNQLLATATLATQSITAIAAQYRLYFTGAGTVTLSGAATGAYSAGSHTITCTAGSLTLTPAGSVLTADLRLEADATIGLPAYQRVTTASDYDETGFPTYWRAQTDDWAKSRMNPNGATKAYVFWAGQKFGTSLNGIVIETSTSSFTVAGNVSLRSPGGAGVDGYGFTSGGTAWHAPTTASVYPSGHRAALRGYGDIANDVAQIVVNSGESVVNNSDQGTGAYTEQDVFFGARAGTSLFANIREYAPPLILFLQPADSLSTSHLSKLQKGYAKAVGVTL